MIRCAARAFMGRTAAAMSALLPFDRRRRIALHAVLLGAVALAAAQPSAAQVARNFPRNALRGEIVMIRPPAVLLNGDAARMAPGARIRDAANMIQLSGKVTGQKFKAHYTLDTLGLIKDVWILRESELANQPWPGTLEESRTWTFNPTAQTWTKP